jgi:hypothetical protein
MFFLRDLNLLSLLLWLLNVLCLIMIQTLIPIIFSTRTLVVLKPRVMWCLKRLTTLKVEQFDLDGVDNEEGLCDALRTMNIGDVRLQEANEDQASSDEASPPT